MTERTLDFARAHDFTALWEGGYVNNPLDPGGETNLGVTRSTWARWCVAQGLTQKPMRTLTPADVRPLYEAWYWRPLAAGLLWPLSGVIYDCYVNHGPRNAEYLLEQARAAGGRAATPLSLALAACDARETFFRNIVRRRPSQVVFLRGWLRRVGAQREWVRAHADGTRTAEAVVFLRGKNGGNTTWDGASTVYGGVTVDRALLVRLRSWAQPGLSMVLERAVRVTVYPDGALQLDRVSG